MANQVHNQITNEILREDLENIHHKIGPEKNKFKDASILLTGCCGFLGYYLMNYFSTYQEELGIKKIIGLDNFMLNKPEWIEKILSPNLSIHNFDVIKDDIKQLEGASEADFIIHMASIASPTFYRKYPILTLDANIWGLRSLLDFYSEKNIKGFLFFSSSEIYGDPPPENIPTKEDYRGNVACIGPRACYDEAKRFGETLCYLFSEKYQLPIGIVRPFNNYGPGMRLEDKRVPADFAQAIVKGSDIEIFSDGSPSRTFCYISDAIIGYLKVLLHGKFDVFNIGIDKPEVSVKDFALLYKNLAQTMFSYNGQVRFLIPKEQAYLTDNPNRRCPNISKARNILRYDPQIEVREGVQRFMKFLKIEGRTL